MKRRLLRSVARWLAGVLLLAQLAIASYACPGVAAALALGTPLPAASVAQQPGASQPGSNAMAAAMPDCSEMAGAPDPGSANLCAEHCKYGQQSDQTPTLVVPAVSLMVLYTTAPAPTLALPRAATPRWRRGWRPRHPTPSCTACSESDSPRRLARVA